MSVVYAARHFYFVVESGMFSKDYPSSGTGAVDAGGGTAMVFTGTNLGPVEVPVHMLPTCPSPVEGDGPR